MKPIALSLSLIALAACGGPEDRAAETVTADSLSTRIEAGADSLSTAADSLDAALNDLETIGD